MPTRHMLKQRFFAIACCAGLVATLGAPVVLANAERASTYYEDALARRAKGDLAGAVIQIKNALQQDKRMLAAHVLLGRTLVEMGEFATAEVALNTALSLGVARSEVLPLQAKALYGQGKYRELVDKLTPSGLPGDTQLDLLVLRGAAWMAMGDDAAAAKSLAEARALNAQFVPLLLADSALQLKQRRLDAALQLAEQAIAREPRNADAYVAKATALIQMQQVNAGLAAYAQAITQQPGNIEARIARATLLVAQGSQSPDAQADLDELTRLAPGEPRAALLRATLAARRSDSKAVQAALGEVVAAVDPMSPESRARQPQLLLLGGTAHYGLGNMQKAREYLEVLVRLQPLNVSATKLLAAVYLATGDSARALTLLEGVRHHMHADAAGLTLMANANLAQKRFQKAAALFQEAAKLAGGDSAELQANLGLSLVGLGQNAEALRSLQAAFDAKPGDMRTGMALTALLLRQQNAKAAVVVMEKVVAGNPKAALAHNMLGVARGGAGDLAGARKAYEGAAAVDGKLAAAQLNLARLDVVEGKPEAAVTRLQALLKVDRSNADAMFEMAQIEERAGRLKEAQAWLEKARVENGDDVRILLRLVDLELAQGRAAPALASAQAAHKLQPENLAVLAALARTQLATGDAAAARGALSNMTRLAEFNPDVQVQIAQLQLAAGNLQGASYSLEKALVAKPEHFPAMALQADLALQANDVARAEQLARTLVAKYPDRAAGHHVLGDVLGGRGQAVQGLASHRTALAREPNTEAALRVFRAHLRFADATRAVAFLQEWQRASRQPDPRIEFAIAEGQMLGADWAAARKTMEGLLQRHGNMPALVNNLASVLIKLQDPSAVGMAERAVKLAPESAAAIDTLGWALARAGQHDKALRHLRDARLRAPQSAEIRYHLAWTLAAANRKSEAREELNAALAAGQSFDGIDEARRLQQEIGK